MAVAQKSTAVSGEKKPRSVPSHPPYLVMIQEAIVALKERSGSSSIAIAKHIEANHASHLPQNFKKILLVQLKKLVANGNLVKVKNSFKLAPLLKSSKPAVEKKPKAVDAKKAKVVAVKPKEKVAAAEKPKKGSVLKKKVAAAKKPKTKSIKSPVKKKAVVARKANK